ncbi:type II toxin-antitoxin system RelE/ParE family toxin [Actinomycetota bacterium]
MASFYKLDPSKSFLKDLKKIPASVRPRIKSNLLDLKKDPHTGKDLKKLTNVKIGRWRLRIGDHRLRYDIIGKDVHLHLIRHRKDIYRK